jgi:hypothetical protein
MGRRETPRLPVAARGSYYPWVCNSREDATGADVVGNHGDASVPAASPIEAVPCEHGPPGSVDLIRPRLQETWHFQPAEWVEFVAAVRDGKFDGAAG